MNPGPSDEETRRQFDALISGAGMDDLLDNVRYLSEFAASHGRQTRPNIRRPPLPETRTFRVRVSLDYSEPPIWRLLEIRSDLTLDLVHQVLQSAFGWWGYHLHRFSIGGGPFDVTSELFLCEFDVEEGEDEGTPDDQVRLDEVLQEAGDVLHYAYDYGDSWELTIRLEDVLPRAVDAPTVVCVAGDRAAPPEDCGGLRTAEDLAEVVDDPAAFEVDEVNTALQSSYLGLIELGLLPSLVAIVNRLRFSGVGEEVVARALRLVTDAPSLSAEEMTAALRPFQWFLDRAMGDGIPLTSAGYLKPADVEEIGPIVPTVISWYGKGNRESNLIPLLEFRESLQRAGLLRKLKGRLLITKAGTAAQKDQTKLVQHLAQRLRHLAESDDAFTSQATLLLLLHAATSTDGRLDLASTTDCLREFGWATPEGPVEKHHLYRLEARALLRNMTDDPDAGPSDDLISDVAASVARTALRGAARPDCAR